jgi:hypothetical protein
MASFLDLRDGGLFALRSREANFQGVVRWRPELLRASNRYYFTMFVAIGFAGFHGECGCGRIQDPITTHFGKKGPAA